MSDEFKQLCAEHNNNPSMELRCQYAIDHPEEAVPAFSSDDGDVVWLVSEQYLQRVQALKEKVEPTPVIGNAKAHSTIAELRRALDNIKVRAYETGNPELHDMALAALQESK